MKNARTPMVVVGLLAVGWWLGSMFKGFGPGGPGTSTKTGTGDGVAIESRDPNAKRTAIEQRKNEVSAPSPTLSGPDSDAGRGPSPLTGSPEGHPPLVTVVIDGASFAISRKDEPPQPATLEQVVALAQTTTGNDQGVRVRVLRRKTAQAGARGDLLGHLLDAGLKRESIQEIEQFID